MTPRMLVVYYSRTGHTQTISETIAAALSADLEAIADPTDRYGLLGYQRSGFQAFFERVVDIGPSKHDPAAYDLVAVGTPVWDMSVSSPVRSYLRNNRGRIRSVAFFCTCSGIGDSRAFSQMKVECGKAPIATLVVRERELEGSSAAIELFAREVWAGAGVPMAKAQAPVTEGRNTASAPL